MNRKWVSNTTPTAVARKILQCVDFDFDNLEKIPTLALNSVIDIIEPIVRKDNNFIDYRSFLSGHLIATNFFNVEEVKNFVTNGSLNRNKFIKVNGSLYDKIL